MSPRLKKLVGLAVLPPGLLLYIGAVVTLAEKVPDFWLAQLVYFAVTGVAWAAPVIPLMKWMEKVPAREPDRPKRP